MLFQTLYFFISIAFLLGSLVLIFSMLLFRKTGKVITGEEIKATHPAYKSMRSFTSNSRILMTILLALILAINLVYATNILVELQNSDAEAVLWTAPVISAVALGFVVRDIRRKFK